MAVAITHPFVSAVDDGADESVVRPSDWNADHDVDTTGASDGDALIVDTGAAVWGAVLWPGLCMDWPGRLARIPSGWLLRDGTAVSRTTYAALFAELCPEVGAGTVVIATGVWTLSGHGLETGMSVYLTTTGALPTGLAANTLYWVIKVDSSTFKLASTYAYAIASTAISLSGTQSGTHTVVDCQYGLGDGSTTFNLPNDRDRSTIGAGSTYPLGSTGGEATHTLTVAEMPAHAHNQKAEYSQIYSSGDGRFGPLDAGTVRNTQIQNTGDGGAHNNLQPYRAYYPIIKT
jgi:microcystin-dependent protein